MTQIIKDGVLRYLNYVAQFSNMDMICKYSPAIINTWINPTAKQVRKFEKLFAKIVDIHTGLLLHPDLTVMRCNRVKWILNFRIEITIAYEALTCYIVLPFRLFYSIMCGVEICKYDEPILFIARYRFELLDSDTGAHDIPLYEHCRELFNKHDVFSWFTETELDALPKPNADTVMKKKQADELNNVLAFMPPELVDIIHSYT